MDKIKKYFKNPSSKEDINSYVDLCFKDIIKNSYLKTYDDVNENDEILNKFINNARYEIAFTTNENNETYLNEIKVYCFINEQEKLVGTINKISKESLGSYNFSSEFNNNPGKEHTLAGLILNSLRISISGVYLYYLI